MKPVVVWFRRDLRIDDNPALLAAVTAGAPVIPLYIHEPASETPWRDGGASKWWLHYSLRALESVLSNRYGSRIVFRLGDIETELARVVAETGAERVFWGRLYDPHLIERDTRIKKSLESAGIAVQSFSGRLLLEPWTIKNSSGKPFQVFSPFWRQVQRQYTVPDEGGAPERIAPPKSWPESVRLDDLELLPKVDWAAGFRESWKPGEEGAREQLERFLQSAITEYVDLRDRPDLTGTSQLSPHLHFGELSPHAVWRAVENRIVRGRPPLSRERAEKFLRQLGWRDFGYHLLFHFPHTPVEPLRSEFKRFPWQYDPAAFRAWTKGLTGYPIVDAGMRQLWHIGWMHNRVRMIVASFLVKDLLIPWMDGSRWFWDTLVDADLANNTLGWQWTAGCGADAAPYFRIFNPVSQGEKFDPNGDYVRRWVPELAGLPTQWIHKPWAAPTDVCKDAGVVLGRDYPNPIVDHAVARDEALEALATIKKTAQQDSDGHATP